jgi:hypothetical protein
MLAVEAGTIRHLGYKRVTHGSYPSGVEFMRLIQDPTPYFAQCLNAPKLGSSISYAAHL